MHIINEAVDSIFDELNNHNHEEQIKRNISLTYNYFQQHIKVVDGKFIDGVIVELLLYKEEHSLSITQLCPLSAM